MSSNIISLLSGCVDTATEKGVKGGPMWRLLDAVWHIPDAKATNEMRHRYLLNKNARVAQRRYGNFGIAPCNTGYAHVRSGPGVDMTVNQSLRRSLSRGFCWDQAGPYICGDEAWFDQ